MFYTSTRLLSLLAEFIHAGILKRMKIVNGANFKVEYQ